MMALKSYKRTTPCYQWAFSFDGATNDRGTVEHNGLPRSAGRCFAPPFPRKIDLGMKRKRKREREIAMVGWNKMALARVRSTHPCFALLVSHSESIAGKAMVVRYGIVVFLRDRFLSRFESLVGRPVSVPSRGMGRKRDKETSRRLPELGEASRRRSSRYRYLPRVHGSENYGGSATDVIGKSCFALKPEVGARIGTTGTMGICRIYEY